MEPAFSYNLLDRFLVTLEYESIEPLIFDEDRLVRRTEKIEEIKQTYTKIGYPVIVPNHAGDTTELIRYFPERLSVFMGQSGAGKSTLLNQISPELNLATGEISDALGRGRHTTRHVELLPIYDGLVADTPGFSSIDFLTIEAGELPRQFPEFVEASAHCKFRECMHAKEPGCEVKQRVETGDIAQTRYDNYLQFLQEIEKRKPMYTKKKVNENRRNQE